MNGPGVALAFTPLGIRPIDQQPDFDAAEDDFAPAVVEREPAIVSQLAFPQVANAAPKTAAPAVSPDAKSKPITGAQLLRQAKARVTEIRRIQRAAISLNPERESLERLIAAATTKPRATPRVVNLKRD